MEKFYQLFEFVCVLIDVQIKKYHSLATIGVGPDARPNAKLVADEVNELISFAKSLITEMRAANQSDKVFKQTFEQVRFYIEQEYLRGYAGWLIDENSIHNGVYHRIKDQKKKLEAFASSINMDIGSPAKPLTDVQKRCEHDSNAIAFKILDLAVKLRTDPNMNIPADIPEHAAKKLRKHVSSATSRYYQQKIYSEIEKLYKQTSAFLSQSNLQASIIPLEKHEAELLKNQHKGELEKLLQFYQIINPTSEILKESFKWYDAAVRRTPTETWQSNLGKASLFGGIVAAAAGVTALYFLHDYLFADENQIAAAFNMTRPS